MMTAEVSANILTNLIFLLASDSCSISEGYTNNTITQKLLTRYQYRANVI